MVEAGLTEGVASRCNKKNDRAKPLFAFGRTKELDELDCFIGQWITTSFLCESLRPLRLCGDLTRGQPEPQRRRDAEDAEIRREKIFSRAK